MLTIPVKEHPDPDLLHATKIHKHTHTHTHARNNNGDNKKEQLIKQPTYMMCKPNLSRKVVFLLCEKSSKPSIFLSFFLSCILFSIKGNLRCIKQGNKQARPTPAIILPILNKNKQRRPISKTLTLERTISFSPHHSCHHQQLVARPRKTREDSNSLAQAANNSLP